MQFITYLFSSLFGLVVHWLVRWSRGRTKLGFVEYLLDNKKYTLGSVASIIGATFTVFSVSSPELSMDLVYQAFLTGYTLDSVVNKDSTTIVKKENEKKTESLSDIVNSTRD